MVLISFTDLSFILRVIVLISFPHGCSIVTNALTDPEIKQPPTGQCKLRDVVSYGERQRFQTRTKTELYWEVDISQV